MEVPSAAGPRDGKGEILNSKDQEAAAATSAVVANNNVPEPPKAEIPKNPSIGGFLDPALDSAESSQRPCGWSTEIPLIVTQEPQGTSISASVRFLCTSLQFFVEKTECL